PVPSRTTFASGTRMGFPEVAEITRASRGVSTSDTVNETGQNTPSSSMVASTSADSVGGSSTARTSTGICAVTVAPWGSETLTESSSSPAKSGSGTTTDGSPTSVYWLSSAASRSVRVNPAG